MYKELIQDLRDKAEFLRKTNYDSNAHNSFAETMSKAANAIEELSSAGSIYGKAWTLGYDAGRDENMPHWIPVKERLPKEENRSYWICTDTGYQCECRWTNNYFGIGESGEWRWCIVDVPQYHKVVAWMDLPEPYKPPKEET